MNLTADADADADADAAADADADADADDTGDSAMLDDDGDGFVAGVDCDDTDPSVHPDADEVCDGEDNNCDGEIDEGVTFTMYEDGDGDGYGTDTSAREVCEETETMALVGGDCRDSDPTSHPGATEYCDDVDNDCDGIVERSGGGLMGSVWRGPRVYLQTQACR